MASLLMIDDGRENGSWMLLSLLGVAAAVALMATAGAYAADESDGPHHEREKTVTATTANDARTLTSLWHATIAREAELDGLVKKKDLAKVHEAAFAIRDLVAALPEKSRDISAEQRAKLAGNARYVATLAERLDKAGDAGDQVAAETTFKQLQSVLAAIEALYPAEALK